MVKALIPFIYVSNQKQITRNLFTTLLSNKIFPWPCTLNGWATQYDICWYYFQRFALLDTNGDGVLTEKDLNNLSTDVVEEAFGQTPPGEVCWILFFFSGRLRHVAHGLTAIYWHYFEVIYSTSCHSDILRIVWQWYRADKAYIFKANISHDSFSYQVNLIGKSEDSSLYNILSALPKQLPHIEEFLSRPDKSSQEIKMFLEKHYQEIHAELIKYLKNKASETLEKSKEYDKEHSEL